MVGESGGKSMNIVAEELSRTHLASGVWGRVTLDQILRKNAASAPNRLAVADFSDRERWTPGASERLTYAEFDRRVEALAAFFAGLNRQPDTVVALQLPPTADSVAIFFATLRAGLIAAPLPLALREAEMTDRLQALGAKAIVTVGETSGERLGERMRDVAAELFQIRFVFGAGDAVPDGLIPLARVYAEIDTLGAAPAIARKGNAADHAATVSVVIEPQAEGHAAVLLPRSHNHWIATGLMTLLEARIDAGAVFVSPFAASGLVGIGVGLMPWLLAAGTLVIGLPASADRIAEEAAEHKATHVIAPGRFARRVAERLEAHRADAAVMIVSNDRTATVAMPRGHAAVDITTIGERAVVARRRRDPAEALPLPIGNIGAPAETSIAPTLVETRFRAGPVQKTTGAVTPVTGEIVLRGAMVPEANWPKTDRSSFRERPREGDGWVRTAVAATAAAPNATSVLLTGRSGEIAGAGPLELDLPDLDRIYKSAGDLVDAAAIPLVDATGHETIAAAVVPRPGTRFDRAAFMTALESLKLGHHRIPAEVYSVPAIARAPSGRVMRAGMASHLARR